MSTKNTLNASILVASFYLNGGRNSNSVRAFCDFSDEIKTLVLENIALNSHEYPAIMSFLNKDYWVLVTSDRIICLRDNNLDKIINEDLEDVILDPEIIKSIGSRYKSKITFLTLVTKSKNNCIEFAEAGGVFWAFLNTVKWISQRNKKVIKSGCDSRICYVPNYDIL